MKILCNPILTSIILGLLFQGGTATAESLVLNTSSEELSHGFSATYATVAIEDQMEQADYVVRGTVDYISENRWNSIDGSAWNGSDTDAALLTFTIDILLSETLKGNSSKIADSNHRVQITAIGYADESELIAGDEVIIAFNKSVMAWEGGGKEALLLLTHSISPA